jgi:hypothetical protein
MSGQNQADGRPSGSPFVPAPTQQVFRQGFGWVERLVQTEQVWRDGFGWVEREVAA